MFTPSGNVPSRQSLMGSHAAFFITWGFLAIYSLDVGFVANAGRFFYFTGPK